MENDHITWREMIVKVVGMTEDEVKNALNHEISTLNRKSIVLRLHQRYTKLRMLRERTSVHQGDLL